MRCGLIYFSLFGLFLDLHHLKDAAPLRKCNWKRNDLKAFGDAWAASVQRKATSNDVCFCSNKSVTTKSVRFREERCCFTSALPSPLTRSQLLSVMAPVQPPWRLNLFKWTTAFIWNLTQESVGITEQQTCTSAKEIWRFSRQPSLL